MKQHKERIEQMNAMVALLASYIRCGKQWDEACESAYERVRLLIASEPAPPTPRQARYLACNPDNPCTWPVGSCRFVKAP